MYKRNLTNCMVSQVKPVHDLDNTEFRESSPIDPLMYPKRYNKDGTSYVAFEDDLFLLFNQERIVGADALNKFIASLTPSARKSIPLTDDQLLSFLKSKYIQSPSELKSWSNYLLSHAQEIKADFDAKVSEKLEEIKSQASDPTNDSNDNPKNV